MEIGITISSSAYTPEAFAYEKYLTKFGHKVQLDYQLDPNNDINIYFMGIRPVWQKRKGNAIEIHEYQSLSVPPYAKIKNNFKKVVNKKPSGRIFLNDIVKKNLNFRDTVPYIYRDMGVEKDLFQIPSKNPKYDIVYCGSISGRPGLVETIIDLSNNFKLVIVGQVSENEMVLLNNENITLLGPVERSSIPNIYKEARFGLNFTPDIFPYNIQTSTKTLEYIAAGLDVISNKYHWAESFFDSISYKPYWLEDINILQSNELSKNITPFHQNCIQEYSWENILTNSNLEGFLRDCLYNEIN